MYAALDAAWIHGRARLGDAHSDCREELSGLALSDTGAARRGGIHHRRAPGPSRAQDAQNLPSAAPVAVELTGVRAARLVGARAVLLRHAYCGYSAPARGSGARHGLT